MEKNGRKINSIFRDHAQIVNKSGNISVSLINHVYIKKILMEEIFTGATVENIYFSDYDPVRTLIDKSTVDFYTISQNSIGSGNTGELVFWIFIDFIHLTV